MPTDDMRDGGISRGDGSSRGDGVSGRDASWPRRETRSCSSVGGLSTGGLFLAAPLFGRRIVIVRPDSTSNEPCGATSPLFFLLQVIFFLKTASSNAPYPSRRITALMPPAIVLVRRKPDGALGGGADGSGAEGSWGDGL